LTHNITGRLRLPAPYLKQEFFMGNTYFKIMNSVFSKVGEEACLTHAPDRRVVAEMVAMRATTRRSRLRRGTRSNRMHTTMPPRESTPR